MGSFKLNKETSTSENQHIRLLYLVITKLTVESSFFRIILIKNIEIRLEIFN